MANIVSKNIGIDLGTASVLLYVSGKGITVREPSVVAVDSSGKAVAFGSEAKSMLGRTPKNISALRPVRRGVISNYSITERMLKHYIRKAEGGHLMKPSVVICIPCLASEIEKKAASDAALSAGARKVKLINEPVAAAIGAGIDINKPCGRMIVDIGGGSCDIAVISLGGIVAGSTVFCAGDSFDDSIVRYVRKKFGVIIGSRTAEEIKIKIGSVHPLCDDVITVFGTGLLSGLPESFVITSKDICDACMPCAEKIVDSIRCVLEKTPPELASDINSNGILMTGGGSLLNGLPELVVKSTGISAFVAKDALSCVAIGAGKAAENNV